MAKRMGNTMRLWILWAATYVLCTICGLIPIREGSIIGLGVMLLGMAFFIPPALLIYYVVKKKRTTPLTYVRNISLISLVLTLISYVLNIVTYNAPQWLQLVANWMKALVCTPMNCLPEQIQLLSVFGWACLLMTTLQYLQDPAQKRRKHRKHRSH